ncbi:MAG TPA: DUF2335 domain-containing protein [Thermoanaerobaculia bacterium]
MPRGNGSAPAPELPSDEVAVRERRPPAPQILSTTIARFETEFFEGPLPHPGILAEYDRICPGAASRILAMAESQSQHRQELEKLVVLSNCRSQDRGPILGFLLAAGAIAVGGFLILHGKEVSGLVALTGALVAVVVPFLYGKRVQRKEREIEEKRREQLPSGQDDEWEYSHPPQPSREGQRSKRST